jgi:hypothetical protein
VLPPARGFLLYVMQKAFAAEGLGLITLKGRSPSPVAKLFLQVGAQVAKSIRPAQSRAAHEKVRR